MSQKPYIRVIILSVLCVLAAAANFLLSTFSFYFLKIPLYLDTVFSAALCFGFGLVPGLAAAILSHIVFGIRDGGFTPYIVCSLAEIFIVWRLRPAGKKMVSESAVSLLGSLLLLYITACAAVSVLGGIIDYFYHVVFSVEKFYFSPEDTVKISLLRGGTPALVMNILSRFPVNIVDRFIVIFGGYFISRGLIAGSVAGRCEE